MSRSSGNKAWIVTAYTTYEICSYSIQTAGVYFATARGRISNTKTDRAYAFFLYQNYEDNGTTSVTIGNAAYDVNEALSCIFKCNTGDKIYLAVQSNYIGDAGCVGYAYGEIRLVKLSN